MIFIDSNIPMYLIGAEHPNKHIARRIVDTAISHRERLVTDAEVFQEIMHRYGAIQRREAIQPAFDLLGQLVDAVLPIELATVEQAHRIMLGHGLGARDAVHIAAMEQAAIREVMSFDADYDRYPGVRRLSS
ncbi:MAG TPA: type II toxin-antitoxin system VapC family toxin [Jatrophihabitantaceae bacterium]